MNKNVYIRDRFALKTLNNFWRNVLGEKWAFLGLILYQKFQEGSTCLHLLDTIKYKVFNDLGEELIESLCLKEDDILAIKNLDSVGSSDQFNHPLILTKDSRLYLQKYWSYEKELLEQYLLPRLEQVEDRPEIQLFTQGQANQSQLLAVFAALRNSLTFITGGPGTGKTSVIARIIVNQFLLFPSKDMRIAIAAPTGKAASRMSESIRHEMEQLKKIKELKLDWSVLDDKIPTESFTIHRLLQYNPMQNKFARCQRNQIPYNLLLLDESTMIDLPLMLNLFRAIPTDCKVILLGDKDQLTSVGVGSVFADIVERLNRGSYPKAEAEKFKEASGLQLNIEHNGEENSSRTSLSVLNKTYRFEEDSSIYALCQAIKVGDVNRLDQVLNQALKENQDLVWHDQIKSQKQLEMILEPLVEEKLKPMLSAECESHDDIILLLKRLSSFCLLSPQKSGLWGVNNLNRLVVQLLDKKARDQSVFHGMPIMITVNDYQNSLYNGDIGVIIEKNGVFLACFPASDTYEKYRLISYKLLPDYQPAYAMTIHKSQGSEYEEVMVFIPSGNPLLCKELIYTGISRCKKRVYLVGQKEAIISGASNNSDRASGI